MIAPATSNKRSTLAEVAGMLRNLTARCYGIEVLENHLTALKSRTIQVRQWSFNWLWEVYTTSSLTQVVISTRLLCCRRSKLSQDATWCRHTCSMTVLVCATAFCDGCRRRRKTEEVFELYRDISIRHNVILAQNLSSSNRIVKIHKLNRIQNRADSNRIPRGQIVSPMRMNCNLNRIAIGVCPSLTNVQNMQSPCPSTE